MQKCMKVDARISKSLVLKLVELLSKILIMGELRFKCIMVENKWRYIMVGIRLQFRRFEQLVICLIGLGLGGVHVRSF